MHKERVVCNGVEVFASPHTHVLCIAPFTIFSASNIAGN